MGLFKEPENDAPTEPTARGEMIMAEDRMARVVECRTKNGATRVLYTHGLESGEFGPTVVTMAVLR